MTTTEGKETRALMGGCSTGAGPDLSKHRCPGRYQRWYHGTKKVGRKSVEAVIYLDEYRVCTCLCHIPEEDRPKPKRTRRKK